MTHMIRELRDSTGMTQKEFANMYGIPLSTLRKWEQGESSPAPYILNLLARTLPSVDATESSSLESLGRNKRTLYSNKMGENNLAHS